jgi:hypothetical protein
MLTPQSAPDWTREHQTLWQRAAAAEKRVDAQEARIIDFSMPRAVPAELWDACIRHVYQPFIDMGMAMQINIHDTPASDGGRNINVHGLATLREIDGDGFAVRKNRAWNDAFRLRNGREVREQFAERLTAFCVEHGVDYVGDARPNTARDLPDPEPELPRWNFEAWKREGEMTQALSALHDHRKRRRQWEAAQADEIEAALDLAKIEASIRERRKRRLAPADAASALTAKPDRRAAVLRAWYGTEGWIDADTVSAIASTRYDAARICLWIDLKDGSSLVDHGHSVVLRGRLTWQAAWETAAAAERHGWESVEVHGDQAYKDAVAVACMLRNIDITNHDLSPKAQVAFDRLRADHGTDSVSTRHLEARSSLDIHLELTKRRFVEEPSSMEDSEAMEGQLPVYKPRFPLPKKKRSDRSTA